jgi:glycosyltransferase involved in cell wall biosynthesis
LQVLRILRSKGARLVVVFHDVQPYEGARLVDRIRRACQIWVMRRAYRWADRAVLTVSLERATWLPARPVKAAFVPVGANLLPLPIDDLHDDARNCKTVAVYGVTGGSAALSEVRDIGHAVKHAASKLGVLRLVVLGRGSLEAEKALRSEFGGTGIELSVAGVLPPEQVVQALALADVLLFVRGGISSRRGSALAGVACELPVVGYRSQETAFPVTEAGVVLVPLEDRRALGEALTQVLANDEWRKQLRARSRVVQEQYLSWEAISRSFLQLLNQGASQ